MRADPILLQIKYAAIVDTFAKKMDISLEEALDAFYNSKTYHLIKNGVGDLHCMSDIFLADELALELK